jgi:hypothetical protein
VKRRSGHWDAAHIVGMTTFNETDHPRKTDGRFTEKQQSAPTTSLREHLVAPNDHVVVNVYDKGVYDDGEGLIWVVYADDGVTYNTSNPLARGELSPEQIAEYAPDGVWDDDDWLDGDEADKFLRLVGLEK